MRFIKNFVSGLTLAMGILWGLIPGAGQADVRLPDIFNSNMVLQRGRPLEIWGWGKPGERVTVDYLEKKTATIVDAEGRWTVNLEPMAKWKIYKPADMTISGRNKIVLENVIVGEVWVCAGDEWVGETRADWAPAAFKPSGKARLFLAEPGSKAGEDLKGRWVTVERLGQKDVPVLPAVWASLLSFEVYEAVGVIVCDGGTAPIEGWLSRETLGSDSLKAVAPKIEQAQAAQQFESFLAPLSRLTVHGLLWVHGQRAVERSEVYGTFLQALADACRKQWGPETGFVYAQAPVIANGGLKAAALREAQATVDGDKVGWVISEYTGRADVKEGDHSVVLSAGNEMTGVTWHGPFATMGYEIMLEARRVEGRDFFCALTVPVGMKQLSLVLGGWGGQLCGISCIDGADAANNETMTFREFEMNRWYKVRMQVTEERVQAWLDDEDLVNAEIKDRNVDIRYEVSLARPLGISSYSTTGEFRNMAMRRLDNAQTVVGRRDYDFVPRVLPKTGMAVTLDLGPEPNLAALGERLVRATQAYVYSSLFPLCEGPLFVAAETTGAEMWLYFMNDGEGLTWRDDQAGGFQIAGEKGQWKDAIARIEGNAVVIKAAGVDKPLAARYGWDADAKNPGRLMNQAGFPAAPFRTDDW